MTINPNLDDVKDEWLIVKRDLYFLPDCKGYTGIRDEAGRYSYDFAHGYEGNGCSAVHISEAPEFRAAAFHDLVIKHLIKQRDDALRLASQREDDPSNDERWNAGLDYGMERFCKVLGVDPKKVNWDAATEELEGDVCAVIGNILRVKYGENFDPKSAQREDVIDREAIAALLFVTLHPSQIWCHASLNDTRDAYLQADAIIRSLAPSQQDVVEAVISELFRASDNAVIAHNTVHELKPYISKAAQPRSNSWNDAITEAVEVCRSYAVAHRGTEPYDLVKSSSGEPVGHLYADKIETLLRSNKVEVGAGRNSIQIESSSDTASVPLSSPEPRIELTWQRRWAHDEPHGWNLDAAGFLKMIQENDPMWTQCFRAKYIEMRIDTRDGAFNLYDRDRKPLNPDEVVDAVNAVRKIMDKPPLNSVSEGAK